MTSNGIVRAGQYVGNAWCGTSAHDIVSESRSYFLIYKAGLIGLASMLVAVSEIFQVKFLGIGRANSPQKRALIPKVGFTLIQIFDIRIQ